MNIVLSEESTDHLDMLDGFLYQLLHDKWKSYAKVRFYLHGARFLLYMSVLITVAYLHPGTVGFCCHDEEKVMAKDSLFQRILILYYLPF